MQFLDTEKIIKSNQEQAVGAWINYLNQIRLDRLVAALHHQDENWQDAMLTISRAFSTIKTNVISRNRGGDKGMHGFIAEIAECGIGNARQQIEGNKPTHFWINDNGPVDIVRGTQDIQQKFVQAGGHLSLQAISMHLKKYPNFLKNGGIYQIPQDHFDKIQYYLSIPESVANKMSTSNGDFSLKQWKEVHAFFESGKIDIKQLEPSTIKYSDAQAGTIHHTFDKEKERLAKRNNDIKETAYNDSKPSFAEGAKAMAISAAIEGSTTFCMAIIRKRKSGKKLKEFDKKDWQDISLETGKGTLKGVVRGISIYYLTNHTATPAAVASAITTASFSVAEQIHLFRIGDISELELIANSEILCFDAAISALSSFLGQALIPIPILGAVIGNTVGTLMYQIAKDALNKKEQSILEGYLKDISDIDKQLQEEYQSSIDMLNTMFKDYLEILSNAFSLDPKTAFAGSVALAKRNGVPTEEILDTLEKTKIYFTE